MSWLKSIFSSDIAEKSVDAIINTGDALFYTDEEKAQNAIKGVEIKLGLLKQFEPFKLAQRYIAIMFTINFILSFWVGVLIFFTMSAEMFDKYLELVGVYGLFWIMGAIITWYFSGGIINSIKKGKLIKICDIILQLIT